MRNIEDINRETVKKILTKKKIPEFFAGDTIKVGVRILEGKRERVQYFEGVCIAKKSRDINSSFTVRKISFGEGVERTFALYSSIIKSIKVVRSGKVKRAKLYYLRGREGKSARISEKIKKRIGVDILEQASEKEEKNDIAANQQAVVNKEKESKKITISKEKVEEKKNEEKKDFVPKTNLKKKEKLKTEKK